MMRHAAHRNRVAPFFVARSERDLQLARADHRIIKKQFVKIAESEEEKSSRMLRLQLLILPDHWGGGG